MFQVGDFSRNADDTFSASRCSRLLPQLCRSQRGHRADSDKVDLWPTRSRHVREDCRVPKVLLIGPTSAAWESIAPEIEADLARLARPGVELTYRCTGNGPSEIRNAHDVRAAAPFVVQTIVDAARDGFDAVIVDSTADPGVADARKVVSIPVVGAGEALRSAMAAATQPVVELTGDDLTRHGRPDARRQHS